MRIVSSTKDYYDYISYQYGSDPGAVYLRGKTAGPRRRITLRGSNKSFETERTDGARLAELRLGREDNIQNDGKYPHIIRSTYYSKLIMAAEHVFICDITEVDKFDKSVGEFRESNIFHELNQLHNFPESTRKNLIKLVQRPVFTVIQYGYLNIHNPHNISVDDLTPNLHEYGVSKLVSAPEMWQSIYTTLTTVLRKNPDKEPPCVVNNEERIQAAGFDLKTSFRKCQR